MLVKQQIKNDLDTQGQAGLRQCFAKSLSNAVWATGVGIFLQGCTTIEQGQTLFQGEQALRTACLDPADHIGDLQAFLIFVVLDQAELFSIQLLRRG